MKKALILTVVILISILAMVTASAEGINDIYYVTAEENVNTVINTQTVAGKTYMFLPSSADLTKLVLMSDAENKEYTLKADKTVTSTFGSETDILSLFNDVSALNGEYKVKLTSGDFSKEIIIMKSENIKSLFLVSEDPVNKGRAWIDTSKSNTAKGNIVFVDADGTIINADEMTEIKARGNSTFTDFTKKAYQFKMKSKFNMTGDENNAQKKWVLLANAGDITLIHNSLVTTLAKDLDLPYTIDNAPVDLYYDGEYRGSYLLTDKVEVGEESVDIQDLDGLIEDANEGTDAYENPVVVVKTRKSKGETTAAKDSNGSYKFVQGLKEPALKEGTKHHAYLLELDFIYRYPDEQSGFVTDRGQAVVTKNPEYLTKDTGAFISQFYQDFEDAVFSPNGYNEKTGKYYYEYCDLDSLVKIYLINEYTKNYDSYRSSTYFYLPEDEDIMYAGPIWDYDLCFTTGYDYNSQVAGNPENFWAATKYLASTLITIESFRDAVKEYLNSEDGIFYKEAEKMLGENGNIMTYSQNVYASQRMNYKIWSMTLPKTAAFRCGDEETYENGIDFLLDFAAKRLKWLSETTSNWNGDDYYAPMDPVKGEWEITERYHEPVTIKKIEPTCTKSGMTAGSVCNGGCGKVFVKREVIPAKGHDYVAIETLAPTCTTEGVITYTCSSCSDSYDETIEMIEHNKIWEVTIPADIGIEGKEELICTECYQIFDERTIPAIEKPTESESEEFSTEEPESESEEPTTKEPESESEESTTKDPATEPEEPSIEEPESEEVSSEEITDAPEAHEHDFVGVVITEPTCTQEGVMIYTCAGCGETYNEFIPSTGHNGLWEIVKPAEIGVEGLKQLICTVCNSVLDEEKIPATIEPTTVESTTVESTTAESTTVESTTAESTTVEPTTAETTTVESTTEKPVVHEHDYVGVVTAEPTCTQEGIMTYTCACGESYDEAIATTGHKGVWDVVKSAEIGVEGLRLLVCTECSAVLASEVIPALEDESEDVSEEITTTEATTVEVTTVEPTTAEITTAESTTAEITTAETTTSEITTAEPTTVEPTTAEKTTAEPTTKEVTTKEPVTDAPVSYRLGDVNLDKKITAADARLALRISAKLEPKATDVQRFVADVVANGKIQANDARLILRVSAKLEKEAVFGKKA